MCNMKIEGMDRAGELPGAPVTQRAALPDQYTAARMAAVQEMAHLARMIEPSEDSAIIWQAERVLDAIRAMPAPVAGSVGDDAAFVAVLNAYRYADIKSVVGKPHPLDVAFDSLVAYIDSRPASAPSKEVLSLHRRLAAETLRADQGWERYESANRDRNSLRAERASAPSVERNAKNGREPSVDRVAGTITGWNDALIEVRATVEEMNLEAFGEHSQKMAKCIIDGVLDAIDDMMATPVVPSEETVRLSDLAKLLPGPYYMDTPDGGDVHVMEQLRRMAEDADKFRQSASAPSVDRNAKYQVLRNELAMIIGCDDGRSGAQKADAVLSWIEREGQHVFAAPVAQPLAPVAVGDGVIFQARSPEGDPWQTVSLADFQKARKNGYETQIISAQPLAPIGAVKWMPTAENINALPEGVRSYIHDLSARSDPSGDVHQNVFLRDQCAGLQAMYRKATDALEVVRGCFEAAEVEGLAAALSETSDEHLKDLVERRLMYALYAAQDVAAQPLAGQDVQAVTDGLELVATLTSNPFYKLSWHGSKEWAAGTKLYALAAPSPVKQQEGK